MAGKTVRLGIKEYCPDMPVTGSGVTSVVQNVIPLTEQSYGPFSSFQAYSTSPLPARAQGAYGGIDPAGDVSVFAGTATNLYQMVVGATTFNNVSKSAGAYSCPADEFWGFTLFNQRVIACNISDPVQTFVLGTDTKFSDLSVDAPKARYATTAKNFLILGNTYDPIGGLAPWRVWWSALGDPTSWPSPGSSAAAAVQSDYNDTFGEGGAITGLVGNLGTADCAVFFEHAVWRMIYVGPPAVFNFASAEGVRGTQAPNSIAQLGAVCFYLGEDGFYMFDGTNSIPIGANKVDKTFFADLDAAGLPRVTAAIDPLNKLVIWAYPGTGNANLNPNRLLIYNWETKRWSIAVVTVELLFRALTFGYTLDGLDATGYNMDTLPFSLDSRVWTNGQILLGAFDASHNLGYMAGPNLATIIETEEVNPFVGQRTFVRNARPIANVTYGGQTPTAAINVCIGYRDVLNTATGITPDVTYTSPVDVNALGTCPQRASGRFFRARMSTLGGASFSHIQGVEIDCDALGVR